MDQNAIQISLLMRPVQKQFVTYNINVNMFVVRFLCLIAYQISCHLSRRTVDMLFDT